jgi:hypothetical protein
MIRPFVSRKTRDAPLLLETPSLHGTIQSILDEFQNDNLVNPVINGPPLMMASDEEGDSILVSWRFLSKSYELGQIYE